MKFQMRLFGEKDQKLIFLAFGICQIMKDCWDQPNNRPEFFEIGFTLNEAKI